MEENKKPNHIEIISEGGLKCDNPNCSYTNDVKFEEYPNWINKPCPNCGENLLTEQDYINAESLRMTIELINSMSEEELDQFISSIPEEERNIFLKQNPFFKDAEGIENINENDRVQIKIDTHESVKAVKIDKIDPKSE